MQSFPAGAGKFQVSKGGGVQPRWRADGKELFYIAPDGKLMAAEVKTVPQFEAGIPQALFPSHMLMAGAPSPALFRYAPSRDGKRFLIVTEPAADQKASEPLTVVLNWTAGLKK